ncbi:MAG: DNA primase catalytic subunit PriS [Thermoplasmata archaeon]|nr:DNA primase catalytic subunit PriS [Thermoplasmata archaeon]
MPPDANKRFLMTAFSRHYRDVSIAMPDRFARREFGFMFFDRDYVMRHLGFAKRAELKNYLVSNVPSHAYYSCAYYEKPNAPTMPEKKWLGADLIFDLDADHVEGTKGMTYENMLKRVKEEVIRLMDEFLLGDLGFDYDSLKVVFSGGRGYHVHINDPRVFRLSSHERREIVDYVTGTDLDIDWIFPETSFEMARFKDRPSIAHKRTMPKLEDGGWRRRMRRGIDELLKELEDADETTAKGVLAKISDEGSKEIGVKTLEGVYDDLFKGSQGKRGVDRMRDDDTFEVFSEKRRADAFISIVEMRVKGRMKGETDEPVTSDIKRLIRLPSSLHGKTGFEVIPMKRDDVEDFDPFISAVSATFGEEPVCVSCQEPVEMSLKERMFTLDEGQNTVPEYAAIYLICRKLATFDF